MVNYQLGKIYKLVSNNTGKQYIGSSCQKKLCSRLTGHVNKSNKCISREIIEDGNYEIILIENFPCDSKDELHKRERYYIENLDCINKVIPTRTKKEYNETNKEHMREQNKERYIVNKDRILERMKEHYIVNKGRILEQTKEYRKKNKERILEQAKEYRKNNKERIKEYNIKNKERMKEYQQKRYREKKLI